MKKTNGEKALVVKKAVKRAEAVKTARRAAVAQAVNMQGEPVIQLATRVPKALYHKLKLYAVGNDISISDLVSESIRDLLVKRGEKLKKAS